MASIRIALAPGDGIGPEIVNASLDLFKAAGVMKQGVEFVPVDMGFSVFATGNSRGMTDEAVRIVEECGLLFKGPMETPKGGGGKSINVTARKLWNAFALGSSGTVVVDAGAVRALSSGGPSLLPAGVVDVSGSFVADDAVEVAGPDGVVFAKGLVRYDAAELKAVAGRRTGDLPAGASHEVVHRNDLVMLPG